MAGFGKRKQVRKELDLTSGEWFAERRPGDRAYASDLEADADFSVLGKMLKIGLKVTDKAGGTSEAIVHLWCTCTAMIPPGVTAVICAMAGVRGQTMLVTCLCVLGVAGLGSVSVFAGARRARLQRELTLRRERQKRTREQRPLQDPMPRSAQQRPRQRKGTQGTTRRSGRRRP